MIGMIIKKENGVRYHMKNDKIEEPKKSKEKTSEDKVSEEKVSEDKTSGEEASEDKSSEDKPSEQKTSEEKKSEDKSSGEKTPSLYIEQEPYVDASVRRYQKKKRTRRIVIFSVLGVLLICYFAGVGYFYTHFSSNTTLNGYDISYSKISNIESVMQTEMDAYTLDVQFKNGNETVAVGDGALELQLAESVRSIKDRQNPFLWFVDIFCADSYHVDYKTIYDEESMRTYLSNISYMKTYNMEPSVDAKVRMENGTATVIADVTGTELKAENVYNAVFSALDACEERVDLSAADCYIPAKITEDSEVIAKGLANAEAFLNINAEYDFNGYKVEIPKEDLSTLAYINEQGNVVVSKTNVEYYARKLADDYSTSYTDRKFRTHDSKTITVYGGYYGWQLDAETEAQELYDLLCAGESFTKEPACFHKGYAYCEENDIGDTYVEIDLSDQHVYVYVDGKMEFDTPCVSGNTSAGRGTPGGLFGITYKAMHVTLKGEDYESPVTYWMPFNGGIGLHDATWRGSFGGSIYYYNGSHGCINLPYSAAAQIYSMVEPGMPVVCYWD